MRWLLAAVTSLGLAGSAIAADLPARLPVKAPPIVPVFSWTGLYIGAHGGHGWGRSSWIDDPAFGGSSLGSHDIRGSVAGGQIGYNWQIASWVFGVEADAAWADLKGSHVDQFLSDLHTKVDALGTIAGRAGYAWGQHLIYLKGGGAWGSFKHEDFTGVGLPLNGAHSGTRWGWTIGGGWEYAIVRNWSAKVEYNYLDFGSDTFGFSGGVGGSFVQTIDDHVHVVKGGVNYRFTP